jgi:hypothetical protein
LPKPYNDETMKTRYQITCSVINRSQENLQNNGKLLQRENRKNNKIINYNNFVDSSSTDSDSDCSEQQFLEWIAISKSLISENDDSGSENELVTKVGVKLQEGSITKIETVQKSAVIILPPVHGFCTTEATTFGVPLKILKKSYTCPICFKILSKNLRGHFESVHLKLKRFLCYLCCAPFYYKYDL